MNDSGQLLQKTAVLYRKTGPAIYHSHHDMIRFWERAVKRAELPMRLTQGYNPRPRMVFPHALGLGIASRHEEVELELYRKMDVRDLLSRIAGAVGGTLAVFDAVSLPPVKGSRQIVGSSYRVAGWPEAACGPVQEAVTELLGMTEFITRRGAPGQERHVDIRPYIRKVVFDRSVPVLNVELIHTQAGSARLDEIVKFAAERANMDWRDLLLEKTGMVLDA